MTASDQNTDSPQAVPNQPPEDTLFGKEKMVMIIEDDPTSAELIRKLLTSRGFDVIQAKNGKEAWDKIQPDAKPDLIISDFLMPEMDGFQFFKGLKKDPQTKDIPTIFLSERKNIQDSLLVSGVDAFFSKPLDTDELIQKIKTLSERGSASKNPPNTDAPAASE